MAPLLCDLRLAARTLRRAPGFAAAAVLTLALGIGATTAVFSVVYAVLIRPLPFPHADRLVQIVQIVERPESVTEEPSRDGLTGEQMRVLDEQSTTLQHVGRYAPATATLSDIARPVRLVGASVTPRLFNGLGVQPIAGRMFVPDDEAAGADPVVILSHDSWRRYFGANPGVIGQRVVLNHSPTRVIAVMPEDFGFPSLASSRMNRNSADALSDVPEFWTPLLPSADVPANEGFTLWRAFAFLRPGVTLEQAVADTRILLPALPLGWQGQLAIVGANAEMTRSVSRALWLFQLGVVLILLIASVNVFNLLLARAAHHRRELEIRLALGASGLALVRTAIAETTLLSLLGGALGAALAYGLTRALMVLPPHVLPRLREIAVDAQVLLFALAVSLVAGLAVGAVAAWRTLRATSLVPLRDARVDGRRRGPLGPSNLLVAGEAAAAVVLLTMSGLLLNSFVRLTTIDTGIDPDKVLSYRIELPAARYPTPADQHRFVLEMADHVRGLPGVETVAAANFDLQAMPTMFGDLTIDGHRVDDEGTFYSFRRVTPDYFRTLGIPLRAGREFRLSDRASAAKAVVVNEAFARAHLAGGALGRVVSFRRWTNLTVIGVVADTQETLGQPARPTLFMPPDDNQPGFQTVAVFVRTSGRPASLVQPVREAVGRLDPELAVYNAYPLADLYALAAASQRLYALIGAACAVLALALGAIGLYGVMAYFVGARTREIGIRIALGAATGVVLRDVAGRGLRLAAIGILLGAAVSMYASQFIRTLLFEVQPGDPTTLWAAIAAFLLIAAVASYLPARRATRIDPAVALRAE